MSNPSEFVERFAVELEAIASKMSFANFGRKPGSGYVDIITAVCADMRKQAASGEIPGGMKLEAMQAVADGIFASSRQETPRTDLPPHLVSLFAAAALPEPSAGKVLSLGEAEYVLNRANITNPQERMSRKMQMEAAGLLPTEGYRRRSA